MPRGVPVVGGSRLHRKLEEASSTLSEVLTTEARTTESLRSPAMVGLAARHVLEAKASGDHRNIGRATPGANAATRQYSGARDLQRNAHSLQTLRSFADGASTPVWTLRVQLQRFDGRAVVELQESSGSSEVDSFAVRHIRDRVTPAGATGREPLVPAGIGQAVWQVEVYVNHRQPVGPMNPLEAVGLLLMAPLTGLDKGSLSDESIPVAANLRQGGLAMTFAFDETTGEIQVINLAAPQYRLKVRLLEASTGYPEGGGSLSQ